MSRIRITHYSGIMIFYHIIVISDAQVHLLNANKDAADLVEARRADHSWNQLHDEVSPSMLIYQGLEFEEQQ